MSNTQDLKVSVIIPTYNGRHLLEANLPAVLKTVREGDQVVVIDDAGTDDTVEWLRKKFDLQEEPRASVEYKVFQGVSKKIEVILIQNAGNLRFGASCNRAVSLAAGEVVWLLNNDVRPESDVLKHVLPYFNNQEMFAVGCQEIQTHEGQKSAGKAQLWFEKGLFRHQAAPEMTTGPSQWVNGGSSFFSHEKWNTLGGFDPAYYPAYWEDIDLCYRARQKGWKIWFEAKAIVHHLHETTNHSVFGQHQIDNMSWRNGLIFTLKNGTTWQKAQFALWQPYWLVKRHRYQQAQTLESPNET